MLRASLDPAQIPAAEADKSVSTLLVTHDEPSALEVHLEVTGPAAECAWVVPATLLVPAGAAATARVVFAPPRTAKVPAGSCPSASASPGAPRR